MTSVIQGAAVVLTAEWRDSPGGAHVPVAGVGIAIASVLTGAVALAETAAGVTNPATGVFAYEWDTDPGLPAGSYLVQWEGTYLGDPVVATEVVDVTAGPLDTYASLSQFKAYRRRTGAADTGDDNELLRALRSGARAIDDECGRHFYLDPLPSARVFGSAGRVTREGALIVDDIGDASILVETGSAGSGTWYELTATSYEAAPLNALARGRPVTRLAHLGAGWACAAGRTRVTARWGWPAIPQPIHEANLILSSRLYGRKDSPEGLAASGDWGAVRLVAKDPDVQALISSYVLAGVA